MRNIIKIFFATLAVFAFASCTEKGPEQPDENKQINENINFTVKALKVEGTTATIKVEHDGTTENPWYGFLTTETDAMKAYQKKVQELLKEGKVTDVNYKTSLTKTFKDLEPNKDYLYIVFGITESGEIYGVPVSEKFKTGNKKTDMVVNPAWTISYTGLGVINDTEYEHTISVKSTDPNKYFITAWDKLSFETYDISDIALYELENLKAWLKAYNDENKTNITLNQMLFYGNGMDAMNLYPGDWYAIAIGVDDNGELSGLYAASEFNIPEEEATESYLSWLGDWTFTGANGASFDVTFHKGINNMLYYMSGWEGTETGYGLDIPIEWSKEAEQWAIFTTNLGTFEFEAGLGDIYILGGIGKNIYPIETLPICIGGFAEDGSRVCYGYSEEAEDGSTLTIEYMQYVAYINEEFYGVNNVEAWPTFPIVITPRAASGTTVKSEAAMERKSVMMHTKAPKPIFTYYEMNKKAITLW